MIILYKTNHFGQFARFARNGTGCAVCRKLDSVRGSFRMCKTNMTHGTYNVYDSDGKLIGEKSECDVITVEWKPEGKKHFVSWEFERGQISKSVAKLAWILDDPKSFAEKCAAPNVTEADVNAASDIITNVLHALQWGTPADLDELASIRDRFDEDPKGDRKKRKFVDDVKDFAIAIQAAPAERQDKLVKALRSDIRYLDLGWILEKLDPAMVKTDVLSIDPHSVGGRGKKGPPWLAARLIVMANAREDFGLNKRRPKQTDDEYFDHVLQALQNACRPGRGKPKSSTKSSKSSTKKPEATAKKP